MDRMEVSSIIRIRPWVPNVAAKGKSTMADDKGEIISLQRSHCENGEQ